MACAPVFYRAMSVVDGDNKKGLRAAHASCCDIGNIAQSIDRLLYTFLNRWPDIGAIINDTGNRLAGHPRHFGNMLDSNGACFRHLSQPLSSICHALVKPWPD